METITIILLAGVIGFVFLLILEIFYYARARQSSLDFKRKLLEAETQLEQDIQEIGEDELSKTFPGRELLKLLHGQQDAIPVEQRNTQTQVHAWKRVFQVLATPTVGFAVTTLLLGVLLGASLFAYDPWQNAVRNEHNQVLVEVQQQIALNQELMLQQEQTQEVIAHLSAQNQALVQQQIQIQKDRARLELILQQNSELQANYINLASSSTLLALIIMSISSLGFLAFRSRRKPPTNAKQDAIWNSPEIRRVIIKWAKENEREHRLTRMKSVQGS